MKNLLRNYKNTFLIITTTLTICMLPLIYKVDFLQNDDWNRNLTVQEFLKGNFKLLDVTATTFYSQGLLGAGFLYVLNIPPNKLPILTLIISSLNFYITALISYEFFGKNVIRSVLFGLLLFFFPLHFYSIIGFMTENFLLFFSLCSMYFFYKLQYEEKKYFKYALASNFFWILAFFSKQTALILPIAYIAQSGVHTILDKLQNKDYKKNLISFCTILSFFILTIVYYWLLFPKTETMLAEKSINLSMLTDLKHVFSHYYALFAYLGLFTAPVLLSVVMHTYKKVNFKNTAVLTIVIIGLYVYLNSKFLSSSFYFKNFPYYPNTFTPQGFFTQGLEGNKSSGFYQNIFSYLGDISVAVIIAAVVFYIYVVSKKIFHKKVQTVRAVITYEFFAILISGVLFAITPFVFDRYIIIFLPISLFYVVNIQYKFNNNRFNSISILVFVLLFSWVSLDYGIEYIDRNRKVWHAAEKLNQNNENKVMRASHAYNSYYSNSKSTTQNIMTSRGIKSDIIFTFSSPNNQERFKDYSRTSILRSTGIFEKSEIEIWEKIDNSSL